MLPWPDGRVCNKNSLRQNGIDLKSRNGEDEVGFKDNRKADFFVLFCPLSLFTNMEDIAIFLRLQSFSGARTEQTQSGKEHCFCSAVAAGRSKGQDLKFSVSNNSKVPCD